ncbi:MAG: hypothetical protein LBQ06_04260 [Frankiaceae bacterium]|jgi:ABC-2 type transport system permease protein|nr:hypothetical protein [Frankiaceae bacterium]
MTATLPHSESPGSLGPASAKLDVKPVTFARQVRSEWHKMWALRSTWIIMAIVVVIMGLFAALIAHFAFDPTKPHPEIAPSDAVTRGLNLAGVAFIAFACMAMTGEYSSGLIRSTLTAEPRRTVVFAAKATVVGLIAAIVGIVCVAVNYVLVSLFFPSGTSLDLGTWSDVRPLVGLVLFLVLWSVIALSIGTLLRNTAAAIAIILCWILVAENLISGIPWSFFEDIRAYLPGQSSVIITFSDALLQRQDGLLHNVWEGFGVGCIWAAVMAAAALIMLRRRDV